MKVKVLMVVLMAVVSAAAGFWGGRELARRSAAKAADQAARECAAQIVAVRGQAVSWADAIAKGQGEAVLRAFVSGISPAILTDRRESLEISAISLLRVPGVAGIHLCLLYTSPSPRD